MLLYSWPWPLTLLYLTVWLLMKICWSVFLLAWISWELLNHCSAWILSLTSDLPLKTKKNFYIIIHFLSFPHLCSSSSGNSHRSGWSCQQPTALLHSEWRPSAAVLHPLSYRRNLCPHCAGQRGGQCVLVLLFFKQGKKTDTKIWHPISEKQEMEDDRKRKLVKKKKCQVATTKS